MTSALDRAQFVKYKMGMIDENDLSGQTSTSWLACYLEDFERDIREDENGKTRHACAEAVESLDMESWIHGKLIYQSDASHACMNVDTLEKGDR